MRLRQTSWPLRTSGKDERGRVCTAWVVWSDADCVAESLGVIWRRGIGLVRRPAADLARLVLLQMVGRAPAVVRWWD